MTWRDALFRVGVYRGIKVATPPDLIRCSLHHMTHFSQVFETVINDEHHIARWLLDECEGPWRVGLYKPLGYRRPYVAFARVGDAVMFRILAA